MSYILKIFHQIFHELWPFETLSELVNGEEAVLIPENRYLDFTITLLIFLKFQASSYLLLLNSLVSVGPVQKH